MSKPPARKSATAGTTPKVRKTAAKPRATSPATAENVLAASGAPRASKNILTAGIKALANAHGEVVARQSRVFESLLGLGPKRDANASATDQPPSASTLDPFGFKKFEDVFDQRVARTIERLGLPSAQAFADLTTEVERLRAEVARLRSSGGKR